MRTRIADDNFQNLKNYDEIPRVRWRQRYVPSAVMQYQFLYMAVKVG